MNQGLGLSEIRTGKARLFFVTPPILGYVSSLRAGVDVSEASPAGIMQRHDSGVICFQFRAYGIPFHQIFFYESIFLYPCCIIRRDKEQAT